MENSAEKTFGEPGVNVQVAQLPEACLKKIHDCELELNKEGFWNIALVAYQMNN